MKNKVTKSIFELFRIEYRGQYFDDDNVPQYPLFDVSTARIGVYSSLAEAEQGMKNFVEEEKELKHFLKKIV